MKVRMEYVFMNLTSVLMYGNSGAEIWESFYTSSGEYYYPMDRGNIYSGRVLLVCIFMIFFSSVERQKNQEQLDFDSEIDLALLR